MDDNAIVAMAREPQALADRLVALPVVPGAQVAGVIDGEIRLGAAGRAGLDGERPVTDDTLFRPGSITKLVTATLVMRCVELGLLDLHTPVRHYLPAAPVDARITGHHLIAHSSGIDAGDLFVDTGDGDDCRARYVELFAASGQLFAPGATFSYNNAGFVLAGHLAETLLDQPWEDAVEEHLLRPLGMEQARFLDGRAVAAASKDHARGHLAGLGGLEVLDDSTMTDDPMCTRGLAPAGATLSCPAADLARLALAHLAGTPSNHLMRRLHTAAPGGVTKMTGVGYSWQLWTDSLGGLRPRIAGANPGYSGVVALDPDRGAAVVALTNSDQGVNAVTMAIDGPGPATVADDEPAPADLGAYAGTYTCRGIEVEVEPADAGLTLRLARIDDPRWGAARLPAVADGQATIPLTPIDRTTFGSPLGPIAFLGEPDLLRWRMRVLARATR